MGKTTEVEDSVQGTQTTTTAAKSKRLSIALDVLKELAENNKLMKLYIEIAEKEEHLNAPIIYMIAQREYKQLKSNV